MAFRIEMRLMPELRLRAARVLLFAILPGALIAVALWGAPAASPAASPRAFLDKHCVTCHNQKLRTSGLALDSVDPADPSAHADLWERVIEKLRAGSMPPPGTPRPDPATYRAVATSL